MQIAQDATHIDRDGNTAPRTQHRYHVTADGLRIRDRIMVAGDPDDGIAAPVRCLMWRQPFATGPYWVAFGDSRDFARISQNFHDLAAAKAALAAECDSMNEAQAQ